MAEKEPEFVASDGTMRKQYYGSNIQPWDIILDLGWAPHFAAGNALKYVRRYQSKNGEDDLAKGRWYATRLHEMVHHGTAYARKALIDLFHVLTEEEKDLLFPDRVKS